MIVNQLDDHKKRPEGSKNTINGKMPDKRNFKDKAKFDNKKPDYRIIGKSKINRKIEIAFLRRGRIVFSIWESMPLPLFVPRVEIKERNDSTR